MKKELELKIEALRKDEKKQCTLVTALGVKHPDFMVEYEKLNQIRHKIASVKDKIKFVYRTPDVYDFNVKMMK